MSRTFGMVSSASSTFYTYWALKSFFETTNLHPTDKIYLIDNDNVYDEDTDSRLVIIRNQTPLTFAQNANILIDLADKNDTDLVFLSNDIILTPGWDKDLKLENTITIPSCNQTHRYEFLIPNMHWAGYGNNFKGLCKIAETHKASVVNNFDRLLMPFYMFYLPKNIYRTVGKLDDTFVNGGEDLDYRVRAIIAGFGLTYIANSYVLHFNGTSTWRIEDQERIRLRNKQYKDRFAEKWGEDLMTLMTLGTDPNSVLIKHNLMSFNQLTDSHNNLIKTVYDLTRL